MANQNCIYIYWPVRTDYQSPFPGCLNSRQYTCQSSVQRGSSRPSHQRTRCVMLELKSKGRQWGFLTSYQYNRILFVLIIPSGLARRPNCQGLLFSLNAEECIKLLYNRDFDLYQSCTGKIKCRYRHLYMKKTIHLCTSLGTF